MTSNKVTLNQGRKTATAQASSPSAEIIAASTQPFTIYDSKGRAIVIKKPGILAQFRLIEAIGDAAKNDVYRFMVLPLIYVVSIDGGHVPPLVEKKHVEALIARLDEAGFEALQAGIAKHYPAPESEESDDSIKKS